MIRISYTLHIYYQNAAIMKKNYFTRKKLKTLLYQITLVFIIFYFLNNFSNCDCESISENALRISSEGIIGTWVLTSAVFRDEVDLDGPGGMLPTTDAKAVFYQIFDMYGSCSSIDDVPIEFIHATGLESGLMAEAKCPEGYGVDSWVFDYNFNTRDEAFPYINIQREKINDPGKLYAWRGFMYMYIVSEDYSGGKTVLSGYASLYSALPGSKDFVFDFVLKKID